MELTCGLFGYGTELERDLKGSLRKLKEIGFSGIEPSFEFPEDPSDKPDIFLPSFVKATLWDEEKVNNLMPYLDEIGLKITSMHVGLLFTNKVDNAIKRILAKEAESGSLV